MGNLVSRECSRAYLQYSSTVSSCQRFAPTVCVTQEAPHNRGDPGSKNVRYIRTHERVVLRAGTTYVVYVVYVVYVPEPLFGFPCCGSNVGVKRCTGQNEGVSSSTEEEDVQLFIGSFSWERNDVFKRQKSTC